MEKKRIVGYIRVSTKEQAEEGVSLAAQERKLIAYAGLYDLELLSIEVDVASGKSLKRRPALKRCLTMLDGGEADGLLIAKLDRLSRKVVDMGNLVDEYFQEKLLISVTDQIDTSTASGRLMLNILTTLAQWERETIGERTSGALQHMKAEGVQLGSAALGWRHGGEVDCDGRRVIVEDEDELMAVARVLELKSNGFSLRGIAESLTRDGYPTKRGGQWAAETVSKILRREAQAARRECLTIQDGGHAA